MTERNAEIELQINQANQFFRRSSAPGYRKLLINFDTEAYIVEECQQLSHQVPVRLVIQLSGDIASLAPNFEPAIRSHFAYRRSQVERKKKLILMFGWKSLGLAIILLAVIFFVTEMLDNLLEQSQVVTLIRESFIILAWVALWRPMEMLIYDRIPLNREIEVYRRLSESDIKVAIIKN